MARLNTFVHVVATADDGAQQSGTFGPADEVPAWAAAAITNPDVWDGEPPAVDLEPAKPGGGELVEPPRAGKGSGAEAWREYAGKLGWFEAIAPEATRDDIVKAVDDERERRAAEAAQQNDGE
ncbi:hypothetical protein [Amycolatopsis sp. NPDC049159]|uniref:hypothetical protein n=1 Tax=Amycolatopsis sp. NPDC049159 TaxID=3157210 RepID=UPI0033EC1F76